MTGPALREALHEVASSGVGPVEDAQLVVMADRARGGDVSSVSGAGGRRRWVLGAVAVAAVAGLMAVGVAQALRPVEVTPASGPGSLPDQIFPSREHILTLEQAPIGRVSMVYARQSMNGDAEPAWIAVGADVDEYRWVARAEGGTPPSDVAVQISPGGTQLALSESGDSAEAFGVEVVDAGTGQSRVVIDGQQAPLGGEVDTLAWSPDGDALFVSAYVVVKRLSDSARRWEPRHFVVSGLATAGRTPRLDANAMPLQGQMVGWSGGEPVVLLAKAPTTPSEPEIGRHDLVTAESLRVVGRAPQSPTMTGGMALSPNGLRLAALSDPTAGASGDGRPWRLQVFDTRSGELLWQNRDVPEDSSAVVGWRDARTPVLYTAAPGKVPGAPSLVQIAEYPLGVAGAVQIVDLGLPPNVGASVSNAALAADVLAAGEVRVAEPPHQPWYDLRTLGPTVRHWVSGQTTLVVLAVVLLLGVATAGVTRLSLRRREAHSRSSA